MCSKFFGAGTEYRDLRALGWQAANRRRLLTPTVFPFSPITGQGKIGLPAGHGQPDIGKNLGALLDAEILADVWLTMTGGQTNLSLAGEGAEGENGGRQQASPIRRLPAGRPLTQVLRANTEEIAAHAARMQAIEKAAGTQPLWLQLEQAGEKTSV